MKYIRDIFIGSFYDFSISTLYNVNNYLIYKPEFVFPHVRYLRGAYNSIIHLVIKYTFVIYIRNEFCTF